MRTRIKKLILLSVYTLSAVCGVIHAGVEDGNWHRYESEHFIFLSALPEEKIADRIRDLEAFRALVHQMFSLADRAIPSSRIKVLLLSDYRQLRRVFKIKNVAGLMVPGSRDNLLVISEDSAIPEFDTGRAIAIHEYIHHLIRDASSFRYPVWFDEGFAEALSTTTIESDHAVVGKVPVWRFSTLRNLSDMSLEALLSVESTFDLKSRQAGKFYARSWLFVHYLLFSPESREQNLKLALQRFLDAYNKGNVGENTFEDLFGISVAEMDEQLVAYEEAGFPLGKIRLSNISFNQAYEQFSLSSGEIAYELAYISILHNPKYARKLFRKALDESPEHPRFLAGRGVAYQFEQKYSKGEQLMRRALALAADDYLLYIELADLLLISCSDRENAACENSSVLEETLYLYRRAFELQPDLLETKMQLGLMLLNLKQYSEAIRLLEEALRLSPSSYGIVIALGMAHAGSGDVAMARTYLNRALGWSVDNPDVFTEIQAILDGL